MKLEKPVNQASVNFKYEIGSNVVYVNGIKKYLSIIVWNDITYEDIKEYIVK